jgi:Dolichyl-phosphate-mannose-protein mannosyltransferase
VLCILVGFVIAWLLFWTMSTAPLDVHIDNDEALLCARHFAFGYKHPPMTGWIFMAWFALLPRQQRAVDLLNVTNSAVALGITWWLLRDHLDKNRALLGFIALILIPLYDIKAEVLNANTVILLFWAATLLFYLRARRSLGAVDAFLAGAFASLTMLGKYWAVFLFAGTVVAALVGPGDKALLALSGALCDGRRRGNRRCPSRLVFLGDRASLEFAESVINQTSFDEAFLNSTFYVLGPVAYIACRAAASERGLLVVCLMDNMPCRQIGEALANNGARTGTVAFTRRSPWCRAPRRRCAPGSDPQ